jgi:hypothetical protein
MLQEEYWQAYEVLLEKLLLLFVKHGAVVSQLHLRISVLEFIII